MGEAITAPIAKKTVEVVCGQLHKFMLIPIREEEVRWIAWSTYGKGP
jgi:hypothetical protein